MLPSTTLSSKLVQVVVVFSLVRTISGCAVAGSNENHATVTKRKSTM